jgi:hypothetical protein
MHGKVLGTIFVTLTNKKQMKKFAFLMSAVLILSCVSSNSVTETIGGKTVPKDDVVRIANDDIEYEIIIIEPGFNTWLRSIARPEGYYSQNYMESRNILYVQAWNARVLQGFSYDPNLYIMQIDYQPNIDYGYEVNYQLYNYFIYFQLTYNQRLSTFIPRI